MSLWYCCCFLRIAKHSGEHALLRSTAAKVFPQTTQFELLPPPYFAKLNFSEVVYIWILFRTSLPPYRIDYCCIGGMTGVYFLVYSPMVRITSLPTDMNGLWIDRWYMRQDWIRPALATAAITSLFYLENCKKIKDFTSAIDPRLERLSWTTSFFYGEKAQKIPIVIKPGRYGRAAHGGIWSWFMTTHSQNYEFVWPKDWKNMV